MYGKQTIAYMATVLWDSIHKNLKELNAFNFSIKQLKHYFLTKHQSQTVLSSLPDFKSLLLSDSHILKKQETSKAEKFISLLV